MDDTITNGMFSTKNTLVKNERDHVVRSLVQHVHEMSAEALSMDPVVLFGDPDTIGIFCTNYKDEEGRKIKPRTLNWVLAQMKKEGLILINGPLITLSEKGRTGLAWDFQDYAVAERFFDILAEN